MSTTGGPSWQDRILKRAVPRPITEEAPPPRELCTDLWALDRQLLHFGLARLPSRTSIVRLEDGSLVVVSPPPQVDASDAAIDSLGPVRHVVVPNSFHYLFAQPFMRRYPDACLLTAPGLARRVPELGFATELRAHPPAAWAGQLEYRILGPAHGPSELLLFHSTSGTLILTDLAFNMVRYPRAVDRLFWRASGIPAGFGPGRTTRSLLLRDREPASRCLSQALEWPIRRIVVAHGEAIESAAISSLRTAFADYLPEPPG